jgi:hypothetical protein
MVRRARLHSSHDLRSTERTHLVERRLPEEAGVLGPGDRLPHRRARGRLSRLAAASWRSS